MTNYDLEHARSTITNAGLALPTTVTAPLAQLDAIRATNAGRKLNTDALVDTLAGKTPKQAADTVTKAIDEHVAAQAAGPHLNDVTTRLAGRAWTRLVEHADDVITQYRPVFDAAADVVVEAHAAGITDATTAEDAVRLGVGPLTVRLAEAVAQLDEAVNIVAALRTGYGRDEHPAAWFITAGSVRPAGRRRSGFETYSYTTLDDAATPRGLGWLRLVADGNDLHSNTQDERDAVLAAHAAAETQQTPKRELTTGEKHLAASL